MYKDVNITMDYEYAYNATEAIKFDMRLLTNGTLVNVVLTVSSPALDDGVTTVQAWLNMTSANFSTTAFSIVSARNSPYTFTLTVRDAATGGQINSLVQSYVIHIDPLYASNLSTIDGVATLPTGSIAALTLTVLTSGYLMPVVIDYGDGNTEMYSLQDESIQLRHAYALPGFYDVRMTAMHAYASILPPASVLLHLTGTFNM
jgi:hypothetical protein